MRKPKVERINVRVESDLLDSIRKDAEQSGWGVSDQVRFELRKLRGLWKDPSLPGKKHPVGVK